MTGRVRLTAQAAIATLAAATALAPVFADLRWELPVVVAVALVAAASELARRTPLGAAVGPPLAAAAVLGFVTASNTADTAWGGVVPTGDSFRVLGALARHGFDDIRTLATPVPTHRGLVLLTVVGLAAVELVVDLIAVTLRRAALAGLPLLALFALCTAVARHGVGSAPFAIGTAGYLWLLLVDSRDRIGRWGRTLGAAAPGASVTLADNELAPSPLSALGRRIGISAIAIGVVVPMVIPGLHGGIKKHGGGNGDGPGGGSSQVVTLNPIVNIRAQLTSRATIPLLRQSSTDDLPGYLRMTSLDRFDGTTFSPSTLTATAKARVSRGISAPAVVGSSVVTHVKIDRLDVHWLPVPTQAESVEVPGDWRYDPESNTIFSAKTDTTGLSYTVASTTNEPSASVLDAVQPADPAKLGHYLALPPLPNDLLDLARRVTGDAKTPFRAALKIQGFLNSPPFVYSTEVTTGDSASALANFLLVTHRGFCQQYATAMAVLARLVGIPSRVAVGFTRGTRQPDGSWLVTSHDAHAWPELYFAGFGWLPFEPTPRSDGQAVAPSFARTTTSTANNDIPDQSTTETPPKTLPKSAADLKQLERPDAPPPPAAKRHRTHRSSLGWFALAVLAVLLPLPGVSRAVGRRRRWARASTPAARAHAAWAELRAGAIDVGLGWVDGTTPRGIGRVLSMELGLAGETEQSLRRLVSAEERARYAAGITGAGDSDGAGLGDDAAALIHAMLRGTSRRRRLVAVVWPRSTMLGLREIAARIADALDLVDSIGVRARRRWARRRVAT